MKLNNEIMLITYADSLGKNLAELEDILARHFEGVIGGLHILPFYPSSADRGFAPMDYRQVDPAYGEWSQVRRLGERYALMVDYMINHISRSSRFFQDFLEKKDGSAYKDLFIRYQDFWPGGEPTEAQVEQIYKRKPRAPYVEVDFADGSREKVWCTFDEEQIDLDSMKPFTKAWNRENLRFLAEQNAALIRLDAFAYATKKPDTSCFFLEPEVWTLLSECAEDVADFGTQILPEIHEHYTMQLKVADHGYYVYDFALPMLLLHALYTGEHRRLLHWLTICPRKQFTTLDTHDGIGVVDARDLMSEEEIALTQEKLYQQGGSVHRKYSSAAYHNLDVYQINCTYYSALGEDDDAYLLARAVQFFAPGIPQVYYVGLMAGRNDVELVERTRTGRDINRHYYSTEEVSRELERPVLQRLHRLMRFRNSHPAFSGELTLDAPGEPGQLAMDWRAGRQWARLQANLSTRSFTITYSDEKEAPQALAL